MDVTVVIGTYGDDERWRALARDRAAPSASAQGVGVIIVHGDTLAQARNSGAAQAGGRWLCFLDADDELEPDYFAAMETWYGPHAEAARDTHALLAPRVRYAADAEPQSYRDRDINLINPCVIGTLVTRDRFIEAGGFWDEPAWEDWSLFRRCWLLGSPVVHVDDAVYRAHSDVSGRNSTVANPRQLHAKILMSHRRWQRRRQP